MSLDSAFLPLGNTVLVAASSSTAGTPTQWNTGNNSGCWVANGSTIGVYLAFGTSLVQAAQPTTTLPCPGLALPSSSAKAFTVGPNVTNYGWISAVTSAGSALVYVTPGLGF